MVRSNCPSISIFFAWLSSLLEVVGRQRPKVGLFVARDCSFRFSLGFLFFPLVHHSVGTTQPLIMFKDDEVRSSDLETGLSSSEDRKAFTSLLHQLPIKLGMFAVF